MIWLIIATTDTTGKDATKYFYNEVSIYWQKRLNFLQFYILAPSVC